MSAKDFRDLMMMPVAKLTDAELAQVRSILIKRQNPPISTNVDLSDEAWRKVEAKAQEENDIRALISFVEGQQATARGVRSLIADRGCTGADEIMAFIAEGGLLRDPDAALVAMREYNAFLREGPIRGGDVVERMLDFYQRLQTAFRKARLAA